MMWYCQVLAESETCGQVSMGSKTHAERAGRRKVEMTMRSFVKYMFLSLLSMFVIGSMISCTRDATQVEYSKYVPLADSVFRITFEYPNSWKWTVSRNDTQTGSGLITTINPDIEVDTTTLQSEGELSPNAFEGGIGIFTRSYESSDKVKLEMDISISNLLETNAVMHAEVVSDETLEIDGHFARKITTKVGPRFALGQNESLIIDDIYILVENKYYVINFEIVESKRSSEFGQGFDHMIETIQFLP